ncbi:hypothetical protein A7K95_05800 [Pediococcus parvulus]|uniref:WxL domain-containing protein n=1 Tax=Pediococcus parvulus TaxID=54062 RepID=A0ABX2UHJ6_9LACO|nr:hypothetical protein A7K95_05800 [Pediococcus parvulus]
MIVKRFLKSLLVFVTLASIFGLYSHQQTYADDAEPNFNLVISQNSVHVGDAVEIKVNQLKTVEESSIDFSMIIPTGVIIDKTALSQAATNDGFKYQLESDKLNLTLTPKTSKNFVIKLIAQSAGEFSISILDSKQALTSNVVQIGAQAEASSAESTSSSSSLPSTADESKNSVSSSSVEKVESSSSQAISSAEDSSSQVSSSAESSSTEASSNAKTTSGKSARTIVNANIKLDQAVNNINISYIYRYASDTDQALTGYIQDPDKEKITVTYTLTKLSGNGATPPQNGVVQTLGTFTTDGANAKTAFSYSLLANKFAAWTTNSVGSVYVLRVMFAGTGGQKSFNIRIVYTDGLLSLTAPSNIDFGSDLNAEFTGNPIYMGKVATGSQALEVTDTRKIPTGYPINGWNLTVALKKQMTGVTTKGVLTNSLHYIYKGTDNTLSSASSPVMSLTTGTPGKTTPVSAMWDSKNGIAFEPTAGQPVAGEQYTGAVTWTLQDAPVNQ